MLSDEVYIKQQIIAHPETRADIKRWRCRNDLQFPSYIELWVYV